MRPTHFEGVIELQRLAFPPPFDEDLLWRAEHLDRHLNCFPEGQLVVVDGDTVIASCSNTRIALEWYAEALTWKNLVGGYMIETFNPGGDILFGLDLSVHPNFRRTGIGKAMYAARKSLVTSLELDRYATACRIPDFSNSGEQNPTTYCESVVAGERIDRTLTPLLRYDLTMTGTALNYWDDLESGHAAAKLEWQP